MRRAPRISRSHAVALARTAPMPAQWDGWLPVGVALALLLAALLGR